MKYIYETHCHGSQCSRCAKTPTQSIVRAYHAAGYTGLVLTDHFIYGNTAVDRSLPWEERMHQYYNAFLEAKAEGDKLDFDVIFGIEHYYGKGKEVLVYGIDLDFLLANPDIPDLPIEAFADRVHSVGGVLIQAHPYRHRHYIDDDIPPRSDLVDGIEVYNAWNNREENLPALALARTGDYIYTCGSDTHADFEKMLGAAGLVFDRRIKTSQEFAQALKEKKHTFRVNFQNADQLSETTLP